MKLLIKIKKTIKKRRSNIMIMMMNTTMKKRKNRKIKKRKQRANMIKYNQQDKKDNSISPIVKLQNHKKI